ncbi:hypothetical protein DB31_0429 [Hyalangium minutum]|uniref:DUF4180 domain-containing protein n=2 Tax=Hyalangium minutum TaxID=394096 RepID=A0A085WWV5_9BACT|nr:hypothetical protein DB31_0429 [Hyalangium minutum]
MELEGIRILELPEDGPVVQDASSLLSLAFEHQADMMTIPAARLGESFFKLATGVAGELVQKFTTYRIRLTILGDISAQVANSNALRSFVYEANKGSQLWFLENREALVERLARGSQSPTSRS